MSLVKQKNKRINVKEEIVTEVLDYTYTYVYKTQTHMKTHKTYMCMFVAIEKLVHDHRKHIYFVHCCISRQSTV